VSATHIKATAKDQKDQNAQQDAIGGRGSVTMKPIASDEFDSGAEWVNIDLLGNSAV
jgi:hypothetical protein